MNFSNTLKMSNHQIEIVENPSNKMQYTICSKEIMKKSWNWFDWSNRKYLGVKNNWNFKYPNAQSTEKQHFHMNISISFFIRSREWIGTCRISYFFELHRYSEMARNKGFLERPASFTISWKRVNYQQKIFSFGLFSTSCMMIPWLSRQ